MSAKPLLLLLAIAVSGCTGTTMFSPTPTVDTEALQRDFSSLIVPGGGASRTFEVSTAGPIAVTLTSTTPSGVTVGVGVGIPRRDGSCALQAAIETPAGSAAQIAIAAESGTYCAKVYDLGTLPAPLPFTVSISRP
jgi:hypothetical protein